MKNVLERTGLMNVAFYVTGIGYGIFFWFVHNVLFKSYKKR